MSKGTIAAVIPLHNKENFVARAVASVLAQERPVDEIIIVDDASTDASMDRIRPFVDERFRLLRRDEPGPGGYAARNLAIRSATSRWIAFLDADDSWKPGFIAEIAALIARDPDAVGCVFTGYEKIFSGGRVSQDRYSARHASQGAIALDFDRFLSDWLDMGMSPIWTSACAIRRDVLLAAGLFPEGRCRRAGDKDMWLRAMARTQALCSPRLLATYHTVTENQVTRLETYNSRPCLCATVEEMLGDASGRRRTLLKRLLNLEVFEYALMVRSRERLTHEMHRGFSAALNPLRYLMLMALVHLPLPLSGPLRWCILRGRALARKIGVSR